MGRDLLPGQDIRARTEDLVIPNHARYLLRHILMTGALPLSYSPHLGGESGFEPLTSSIEAALPIELRSMLSTQRKDSNLQPTSAPLMGYDPTVFRLTT